MKVLFLVLHKSYGDLLYNSLLFKNIRYHDSSIEVHVFTTSQGLELYQNNPYIDFIDNNVLSFKYNYDYLIDTAFKGMSYFYAFKIRAKYKVAMIKKPREKMLKFIYNNLKEFKPQDNEIKNTLQILYDITKNLDIKPYFPIFKENPFKGKNYILISPTAPVKTKIYDIKRFNKIAKSIHDLGYEVIFCYPSSERDYVYEKLDFAHYVSTDIHTFASILKDAKLLISCETFSYHLSGFLGVPSITILGGYPMWRVFDYQDYVSLDLDCQYCGSKTCERGDMACLNIDESLIIAKAKKLLL